MRRRTPLQRWTSGWRRRKRLRAMKARGSTGCRSSRKWCCRMLFSRTRRPPQRHLARRRPWWRPRVPPKRCPPRTSLPTRLVRRRRPPMRRMQCRRHHRWWRSPTSSPMPRARRPCRDRRQTLTRPSRPTTTSLPRNGRWSFPHRSRCCGIQSGLFPKPICRPRTTTFTFPSPERRGNRNRWNRRQGLPMPQRKPPFPRRGIRYRPSSRSTPAPLTCLRRIRRCGATTCSTG